MHICRHIPRESDGMGTGVRGADNREPRPRREIGNRKCPKKNGGIGMQCGLEPNTFSGRGGRLHVVRVRGASRHSS